MRYGATVLSCRAGVLQAAEQKGAKNKRLESFIPEALDRVVLSNLPA